MESYKKLAELLPGAGVLSTLYSVPLAASAVCSSVLACNQGSSIAKFRLSHAVAAAPDSAVQYLYRDEEIPAGKTFAATLGITMASTDVLRCQSDNGQVSFNAYGSELT